MKEKKEVGLLGLTAIVIGSVIGGGIFNVSKEIAETTSIGAALIGWLISGTGVFFIVKVFQSLIKETPEINNGIYKYARIGFGDLAGFSSAWGYWLSCVVSNASYPILIVQTLSYFFPFLGGVGTVQGIIFGSLLLWGMTYIGIMGIKTAETANNLATLGKFSAITMAIGIMIIGFKSNIFFQDFWGLNLGKGNIFDQVKGCMLQTLWALIGIEGAVVISGRAKKKTQVGIATMVGYIITLALYLCIVIFSYGIIPAERLSQLKDPALAYIIEEIAGPWGATFINISVLISIFGAWLSWTLIAAEIPYNLAEDGLFPKYLSKINSKGAASGALIFNGVIKQLSFLVSLFVSNAYLFVTNSAAALMLLPYIFSALFLIKISYSNKKIKNILLGLAASLYGIWMIFSAGGQYLFQTTVIYLIGIAIYFFYRKKDSQR